MRLPTTFQYLKPGLIYFALVFTAGFLLGPVRELWVVPRLGVRMAELIEAPIMLVVIVVAARWTVGRLIRPTAVLLLYTGLVALGLLLLAEFTVVLGLRGLTVEEYVAVRDPVAGSVYMVMLAIFALTPLPLGPSAR